MYLMTKAEKLRNKLINETISASEARTLLEQKGWILERTRGSHERWHKENQQPLTIATHEKELPRYQIKQIKKALGV